LTLNLSSCVGETIEDLVATAPVGAYDKRHALMATTVVRDG